MNENNAPKADDNEEQNKPTTTSLTRREGSKLFLRYDWGVFTFLGVSELISTQELLSKPPPYLSRADIWEQLKTNIETDPLCKKAYLLLVEQQLTKGIAPYE